MEVIVADTVVRGPATVEVCVIVLRRVNVLVTELVTVDDSAG